MMSCEQAGHKLAWGRELRPSRTWVAGRSLGPLSGHSPETLASRWQLGGGTVRRDAWGWAVLEPFPVGAHVLRGKGTSSVVTVT